VGFASVAISFGPFLYASFVELSGLTAILSILLLGPVFPAPLNCSKLSSVRSEPPHASGVLVAAFRRTKVHHAAVLMQRNRQILCHMHAANRVAYQPPLRRAVLRPAGHSPALLRVCRSAAQHPRDRAPQQRYRPGQNQHPKQKPKHSSNESHFRVLRWAAWLFQSFTKPLCRPEASVCKGKRASQTKTCDFNTLRGERGHYLCEGNGTSLDLSCLLSITWRRQSRPERALATT
jgi:hypothetical protein